MFLCKIKETFIRYDHTVFCETLNKILFSETDFNADGENEMQRYVLSTLKTGSILIRTLEYGSQLTAISLCFLSSPYSQEPALPSSVFLPCSESLGVVTSPINSLWVLLPGL